MGGAQWRAVDKLIVWCSHTNYLGDDLACVTISLSPTEELATKEASYARPTVTSQNFDILPRACGSPMASLNFGRMLDLFAKSTTVFYRAIKLNYQ